MSEEDHPADPIRADWHRTATRASLAAVLLIAATARFWALGFGLPHTQARPDESRVINLAVHIAGGDLNPHYFVYPTLYIYLVAAALKAQTILRGATDASQLSPRELFMAGRVITAICGVATVWVVYAIGRRVSGVVMALSASTFTSIAFLHVRDSHFGTTDVPMTCVVMLALLLLLRRDHGWRQAALCGAVTGLAASIKYNAVLLLPVAVFLEAHAAWSNERPVAASAGRLGVFGAAMILGFLVGTPYALVDRTDFLAGLAFVPTYLASGHVHDGQVFAVSDAWRHYATQVLPAAVGWPICVAGAAGLLVLAIRDGRHGLACVMFPIIYYVVASRGETVFARYMIPVVPFLCLGAGAFVSFAAGIVRSSGAAAVVAIVMVCALAIPTASTTVLLDRLLAKTDNRLIAADWLDSHAGSSAFCETGSRYGRPHADRDTSCPSGDAPAWPEYIVVQESPLRLYSTVSPGLDDVLGKEYVPVQSFKTGSDVLRETDYDQADAFFVPLRHLDSVRRPGPEFTVYQRRSSLHRGEAARD